jgi:hypothetical protein
MKIEIGESLVYSWLRHVKQCQIVQTNWKVSPKWQAKDIDLNSMKKAIENEFKDTKFDIFHKNSSINQLLHQAEIDVVGISNGFDNNNRLYHFVDVAFHEGGLSYGAKEETISRVLKKFIRSYFIYLKYFCDHSQAVFYFITPKMSNNIILVPLSENIRRVTKVFNLFQLNADFQLLVNQDFNKHVLLPTIEVCDEIADTNELFLRSVQLWKMFDNSGNSEVITPQPYQKETNLSSPPEQKNEQPPQDVTKAPGLIIFDKPLDKDFPKLHKIELWAKKPKQYNHKIIKAYLHLEKSSPVSLHNLQVLCAQTDLPYYVKRFDGNYNSMKTDAGNSHGKVFFDNGVIVSIYPPVREEIKKWFKE